MLTSVSLHLVITVLVAWWLCRQFINPDSRLHLLDHPNARSLHTTPVPRSGGVAILVAIGCGFLLAPFSFSVEVWWVAGAALIVAIVSIADDWLDLAVTIRFAAHLIAASIVVYGVNVLPIAAMPPWSGSVLLVLATVWLINLYNFMDGMDGFAGGMGVIGFGFLALAGLFHQAHDYVSLALLVAAANAGFLWFNFPPAKIFMGDAGSATMGFLVAGFSLWGIKREIFDLWFPLLVFSPFIVDATLTLLRRALRGEQVWQAHREHYYQRLTLAGWGHKKTVLVEYLLMLAVGTSSIFMLWVNDAVLIGLGLWVLIYAILAYKADRFCE